MPVGAKVVSEGSPPVPSSAPCVAPLNGDWYRLMYTQLFDEGSLIKSQQLSASENCCM